MRTSEAGRAFITRAEGLRLKAYPDPATGGDPWTIGVGHTSAAGPPVVRAGMTITADEAMTILSGDLRTFESAVCRAIIVPFTQTQFDAFVSLAFNIGAGAFGKSSVARRFNDGDVDGAANAFLMWNKAAGKVMPGLTARRTAERTLFRTGNYGKGIVPSVPAVPIPPPPDIPAPKPVSPQPAPQAGFSLAGWFRSLLPRRG